MTCLDTMRASSELDAIHWRSSSVLSPTDSWSSYFDTWIDEPITPQSQSCSRSSSPRIAIPWRSSSLQSPSHDVAWLHTLPVDLDSEMEAIHAHSPPGPPKHAPHEPAFRHHHAHNVVNCCYDALVRQIYLSLLLPRRSRAPQNILPFHHLPAQLHHSQPLSHFLLSVLPLCLLVLLSSTITALSRGCVNFKRILKLRAYSPPVPCILDRASTSTIHLRTFPASATSILLFRLAIPKPPPSPLHPPTPIHPTSSLDQDSQTEKCLPYRTSRTSYVMASRPEVPTHLAISPPRISPLFMLSSRNIRLME